MQPLKLIVIVELPGRLQYGFYVASAIKGSVFVLQSCGVDNNVIRHFLIFYRTSWFSAPPDVYRRAGADIPAADRRDSDNGNRDRIPVRPEANIFRFMCAHAQNVPDQGLMIASGTYSSSSSLRMKLLQHRRPGIAISFGVPFTPRASPGPRQCSSSAVQRICRAETEVGHVPKMLNIGTDARIAIAQVMQDTKNRPGIRCARSPRLA